MEQFTDVMLDFTRRSAERYQATAALMSPEQAEVFLQVVEEEDSICFEERQRNPDAFLALASRMIIKYQYGGKLRVGKVSAKLPSRLPCERRFGS